MKRFFFVFFLVARIPLLLRRATCCIVLLVQCNSAFKSCLYLLSGLSFSLLQHHFITFFRLSVHNTFLFFGLPWCEILNSGWVSSVIREGRFHSFSEVWVWVCFKILLHQKLPPFTQGCSDIHSGKSPEVYAWNVFFFFQQADSEKVPGGGVESHWPVQLWVDTQISLQLLKFRQNVFSVSATSRTPTHYCRLYPCCF